MDAIRSLEGIRQTESVVHAFLMMGQSNMAGRGNLSDVDPIENELCFMLRMGRWQPMREPINVDRAVWGRGTLSGVGPAASFADQYAKYTMAKTGLIPCADGGTALLEWMPGETLFDHAVAQAKLAMRTAALKGILWHQGESDCTKDDVPLYGDRFREMITALREELGLAQLPVLIGELPYTIGARWHIDGENRLLNGVFHALADALPACAVVSAEGLKLKQDGLHFDAASQRIFGARYFQVYQDRFCSEVKNSHYGRGE